MRTLIDARWVVGHRDGGHVLMENAQVVVDGHTIAYVGRDYTGTVDRRLDARDKLLTPGFVVVHAHVTNSPLTKSFLEDQGNPFHYMSGLYEYLALTDVSPEDALISARASLVELTKSGVTTVSELGMNASEGIVDLAASMGLRLYIVPMYKSARWYSPDGRRVLYEWRDDGGMPALDQAVAFIEKHDGTHDGRIRAYLGPAQIDTCTPELLRRTAALAESLDTRVQIHAGQAVIEFQEITRRHGLTPIELLHDVGLLNRRLIVGHCIFVSGHPAVGHPGDRDLERLAASGASVAHCPWVFGRRGIPMRSFPRYRKLGINVALGTDTFPQDILHEMRVAAVLGKVVESDPRVSTAADAFTAATLGGAHALGRDDLGRLAPGAKADLVLFDLGSLSMAPVRDPIKNLVFTGNRSDVHAVMVDGRFVVEDGRMVGVDERAVTRDLQSAAERLWRRVAERDWGRRTIDQISPPSFPVV